MDAGKVKRRDNKIVRMSQEVPSDFEAFVKIIKSKLDDLEIEKENKKIFKSRTLYTEIETPLGKIKLNYVHRANNLTSSFGLDYINVLV